MTLLRGTCPLETCQAEDITAKHYSGKHGIRLTDHFNSTKNLGVSKKYCLKHREVKVDGPHEAMRHLIEEHPELFSQESQGTTPEAPENEREIAPEQAFANATVGGVFQFLVEERQKAETKVECLGVEMGGLAEKLRIATESNAGLELNVTELTNIKLDLERRNLKLNEENSRILEDNKAMNANMFHLKNGTKLAEEFREVHGELQGRKG